MKICLAGCGGIGRLLAPPLARMYPEAEWALYDNDFFEEHNCGRQCFPREHIGWNKAVSLAVFLRKLGVMLAIDHPEGVNDEFAEEADLFVGATDNIQSRRTLAKRAAVTSSRFLYVGNEVDQAEAFIWAHNHDAFLSNIVSNRSPAVWFPNWDAEDDFHMQGRSCMTPEAAPQTAAANMMAASLGIWLLDLNQRNVPAWRMIAGPDGTITTLYRE